MMLSIDDPLPLPLLSGMLIEKLTDIWIVLQSTLETLSASPDTFNPVAFSVSRSSEVMVSLKYVELLNSRQSSGSGKETLNKDAFLGFSTVIFWVE